ncbi:MAG: PEP-CTERM sorting domain-containing protein [Planctomycetota bacterium]
MNIKQAIYASLSLLSFVSLCHAQFTVDSDLGTLAASTNNLVGDTSDSGQDSADTYQFPFPGDGSTFNYGGEFVYQFSLGQRQLLSVFGRNADEDVDFFLMDSLDVSDVGGKRTATGLLPSNGFNDELQAIFFLDNTPETTAFGLLEAGTYYLSATRFLGFDGGTLSDPNASTAFDIDLIFSDVVAPTSIDLGVIANVDEAFSLDTFGSSLDTKIGLYDSDGNVIAENDDASGTDSQLTFGSGLAAGEYYLSVSYFDVIFGDGFFADPGTEGGDFALNYGVGNTNGSVAAGEVASFSFVVAVPEPASSTFMLAGLALVSIRRKRTVQKLT